MPKALFAVAYADNQFTWPVDGDGNAITPEYLTGEQVERPQRDQVFEDRAILDENGEPTGETESVFVGWGDEYIETVDEVAGGSLLVSPTFQGNEDVALVAIHTSAEKMAIYLDEWFLVEEIAEEEDAI